MPDDMGQLYPVLIEKTHKKFKKVEAEGAIVLLIGLLITGLSLSVDQGLAGVMCAAIIGGPLVLFGTVKLVVGLFMAWWNHG